ncbi:hypothetical protein SELMODRAFT_419467 [Selaginella moellendorffii]|uniref:Alpha/beta hydrolase fold-3 domain-containing protein n=1 Tax=Selaginella moellendorffii TaxID=88036 RepID=D8S918_SELML|nr:hypothetical protein SELMODRAFT_419467 [Selaginella moellendorffii]
MANCELLGDVVPGLSELQQGRIWMQGRDPGARNGNMGSNQIGYHRQARATRLLPWQWIRRLLPCFGHFPISLRCHLPKDGAQQSPVDRDPWLQNVDFSRPSAPEGHGCPIDPLPPLAAGDRRTHPTVVPFFGAEERSKSEIQSLQRPDSPECRGDIDPMPPSLLLVRDLLYSRQVEYYQELPKAGKDAKLVEYPDRGHSLPFPKVEGEMDYSYGEMIQFVDKYSNCHAAAPFTYPTMKQALANFSQGI